MQSIFDHYEVLCYHRRDNVLILGILVLWVVLLSPFAYRWLRDRGGERSIETFHHEHESLRRRGYSVQPARVLEDEVPLIEEAPRRPRLRVVRDEDTLPILESEMSWEEWGRFHGIDAVNDEVAPVRPARSNNPYAAYAATPPVTMTAPYYEEVPLRRVSMRTRRHRIATALVSAAVFFSGGNLLFGVSLFQDLAIVAWLGVVGYAALALTAVALGYLDQSSLGLRRPRVASVTPLDVVEEAPSAFYEDDEDSQWRREPSRYALG